MAEHESNPCLRAREQALARQLIEAVERFNIETTGIRDVRELLVTETGDGGESLGGVYGWSWDGDVLDRRAVGR